MMIKEQVEISVVMLNEVKHLACCSSDPSRRKKCAAPGRQKKHLKLT
ncbi:MAG: hypothetical protein WA109_13820 [Bellilinea sp.]